MNDRREALVEGLLSYLEEHPLPETAIQTCGHRWPYPAGWNRATDAERRERWPEYCEPCSAC